MALPEEQEQRGSQQAALGDPAAGEPSSAPPGAPACQYCGLDLTDGRTFFRVRRGRAGGQAAHRGGGARRRPTAAAACWGPGWPLLLPLLPGCPPAGRAAGGNTTARRAGCRGRAGRWRRRC